jgi:hypothetical protein
VCRGLKQKNALIACIRARENCDFLVFFFFLSIVFILTHRELFDG